MKVHYLYITSTPYDNGVYQTQVIDWLNIYREKGINFSLMQFFTLRPSVLRKVKSDKDSIIKAFSGKAIFHWRLPQKILPPFINKFLFLLAVRPYLKKKEDKVVIFSRSHIAKEIEFLRRYYPSKVIYYYDVRGAFPEEYKDTLKYNNNYNEKAGRLIGEIYYSCYCCQKEANKLFAVSHPLMEYYKREFDTEYSKFVHYPCLSTSTKFYYDEHLRSAARKELKINDKDIVLLYSGGLDYSYSFVDEFIAFFKSAIAQRANVRLLVVAKRITSKFLCLVDSNPEVKERLLMIENAPNNQMIKYLNVADYGFLLRNNTLLNNVASPVKFAEYQLCGLPVLISEAVIDYSEYCRENRTGIIILNEEFNNKDFTAPVKKMMEASFDRDYIAKTAKINLSKEGYVDQIINQIKY